MVNSGKTHWKVVKYTFRYLKETVDHEIVFDGKDRDFSLVRFYDSDCADDRNQKKSTSCYVFIFGRTAIS